MRLIKLSSVFAVLGFVFLGLSYLTAKGLEESKTYKFPESVARHYTQVSGNIFEGTIGGNEVLFKKSIPVDPGNPFDTVDIETTAVNIEIATGGDDGQIEIELMTNKVDPKEPILIDSSRGKTLRIMTQEEKSAQAGKRGWMVFNFGDDTKPVKRNFLQIRIPKGVSIVKIQTVSGDTRLATPLKNLHVQSKSGDFAIATSENPLARVESLTFQTVSGDLKGPGRFDRLDFDSVSGDIKLTSLDRVLDIDGATVSGDMRVSTVEPLDLSIDFQTTSGDLRIANSLRPLDTNGKRMQIPKRNGAITFGKGTVHIKFHSVSGDLKLRNANTPKGSASVDDSESDDGNNSTEEHDDEASIVEPQSPSKVGNGFYAEEFLACAAKIAAREQTRIGASAARRCFRIIV